MDSRLFSENATHRFLNVDTRGMDNGNRGIIGSICTLGVTKWQITSCKLPLVDSGRTAMMVCETRVPVQTGLLVSDACKNHEYKQRDIVIEAKLRERENR